MKQQYGIGELIVNIFSVLYTKTIWKGARLIRRPFYMRGKKNFQFGKNLTVGYNCRFEIYSDNFKNTDKKTLIIGNDCKFGDRVHLSVCKKVTIGNDCLFASNILVTDNQHGVYNGVNQTEPDIAPDKRMIDIKSVVIGNNCWIGENVVILPGVSIGSGCVIGANSVVNKNFTDNLIIVGNPAKAIKCFDKKKNEWVKI